MFFESFESRRLLSSSLNGGVVTVTGGADFWISATNPTRLIVKDDDGEHSFARSGLNEIHVIGTSGSNTIDALVVSGRSVDIPMLVEAGDGRDTVIGGSANDTLIGSRGNDSLHGEGGDDVLSGGGNRDALFGDGGNDTIKDGAGIDTLHGGSGNDTLISRDTSRDLFESDPGSDTFDGDQFDLADYLSNSGKPNNVSFDGKANDGPDGNDNVLNVGEIFSSGTNDVIDATNLNHGISYTGNDGGATFKGSQFADQVDVFNGTVFGNGGSDRIITTGACTIDGGGGGDYIYAGEGNDSIDGGTGNDRIFGNGGDDTINGGAGNDTLHGDAGDDLIHGSSGNDKVFGDAGTNTLFGDAGADTFMKSESDAGFVKDFDASVDVLI